MSALHPSDSTPQRLAEVAALSALEVQLGFPVQGESLKLGDDCSANVDGINLEHHFICEVFSRIGKLQAAQVEKVASDILKLNFIEGRLGGIWRKSICFIDETAANTLRNRSWLAAVARTDHIEVIVAAVPLNILETVKAAQARQFMSNPLKRDG